MPENADLLLFSLAAISGGVLGKWSKIPGGALLGATVAVAVTGILSGISQPPPPSMVLLTQILMGCMLGQSINRRFWRDVLDIWRPCLAIVIIYTILAAPFAALLVHLFGFDALTAVLASTPARMQDMIVLAGSLDTDPVTVMLMQLVRQFAIIAITPFLLAKFVTENQRPDSVAAPDRHGRHFQREDAQSYAILLAPGIAGGLTGHLTGHILGALLGAFAAVAASRIIWLRAGEVPFPKPFAFLIQCLAGILLGSRVTPEIGRLIMGRIAPLVAACLFVLAAGLLVARVLHRRYRWHKGLSWMAAAPGRSSDMLSMSQDIELSRSERLALMSVHTVRQVYFTLLVSAVTVFF